MDPGHRGWAQPGNAHGSGADQGQSQRPGPSFGYVSSFPSSLSSSTHRHLRVRESLHRIYPTCGFQDTPVATALHPTLTHRRPLLTLILTAPNIRHSNLPLPVMRVYLPPVVTLATNNKPRTALVA
jgi:hypothetical protein